MQSVLDNYVSYWETWSLDNYKNLESLTAPQFVYKTPLYQRAGRRSTQELLLSLLKKFDSPCFIIKDKSLGNRYGNIQYAYFRWTLNIKRRKLWVINGITGISIDVDKGRVTSHTEHWDTTSQIYAKLPVLGTLLHSLKKLFLP